MAGRDNAPEGGLRLGGLRELLLPFAVGAAFLLYYVARVQGAVVAGCVAPLFFLYMSAPGWATRSTKAFDRDLVSLLSRRNPQRLTGRYARAVGMRLFAPPAVSAERRALVAAESGQPRAAYYSYREALADYGAAAPLRVLLGYAHAAYQIGEDVEAIRVYRQLSEGHVTLPGVQVNLAHALVRSGEAPRDALPLLERALDGQHALPTRARLVLIRALAHAKLGELTQARDLTRQFEALAAPESSELSELRGQLDAAVEARATPHA